jgi:hypothetical protein
MRVINGFFAIFVVAMFLVCTIFADIVEAFMGD